MKVLVKIYIWTVTRCRRSFCLYCRISISSAGELCHCPVTKHPCVHPQIVTHVPILILGRSQLRTQIGRVESTLACWLTDLNALFQTFPCPIYNLGTRFHHNSFPRLGAGVLDKPNISRRLPFEFASHFDAFFSMDHLVMKHSTHLGFVWLCSIGVSDHLSVLQMLGSQWFPFGFANRTWSWSTFLGWFGTEAPKEKRLRATAFNNATPLLPLNWLGTKFSESLTSYFLLLGSGRLQPFANASEFNIVLRLCNVDSACLWFFLSMVLGGWMLWHLTKTWQNRCKKNRIAIY